MKKGTKIEEGKKRENATKQYYRSTRKRRGRSWTAKKVLGGRIGEEDIPSGGNLTRLDL